MRGTPLPSGAYLAGLLGNAVTNAAIQLVIVVLCGTRLLRRRLAAGLAGARRLRGRRRRDCLAALGVAFSHAIPNFDAAPAYTNIVFLPVIFISGVFYDAENAPALLRDIAEALPLTHLIDGLSNAMVGGASLADSAGDLLFVCLWGAVGLFFAVRGFRWESRRA